MTKITLEQISSYLDGELSGAVLTAVELALASDAALGAQAAQLARTQGLLRAAFVQTIEEPVPDRFEVILNKPSSTPTSRTAFFPPLRRLVSPMSVSALAASLLLGLVVGRGLTPAAPDGARFELNSQGAMVASADLGSALSKALAGKPTSAGAETVTVQLSFRDAAGRYCRQFQLSASSGLACMSQGAWTLEILAQSGPSAGQGGYVMARGPTDPEINAALIRVGVAEVLAGQGESQAIAAGWKAPISN